MVGSRRMALRMTLAVASRWTSKSALWSRSSCVEHRGVEPDRVDDAQVVDLVAGDVAGADGVEHAVGDRRLDGAHQDVGVLAALDRDLAHHHRGRLDLHVAAEDREDLGVPLDLVADQVGQGVADRAVQLADDDLRLGAR